MVGFSSTQREVLAAGTREEAFASLNVCFVTFGFLVHGMAVCIVACAKRALCDGGIAHVLVVTVTSMMTAFALAVAWIKIQLFTGTIPKKESGRMATTTSVRIIVSWTFAEKMVMDRNGSPGGEPSATG